MNIDSTMGLIHVWFLCCLFVTFTHLIVTNNRLCPFFVLQCYPLQTSGFPLKTGSHNVLTTKTWKYLLKYGFGGGFVFWCYFLLLDFVHLCVGPGILYLYLSYTLLINNKSRSSRISIVGQKSNFVAARTGTDRSKKNHPSWGPYGIGSPTPPIRHPDHMV